MPDGVREPAGNALKISENAIPALGPQSAQRVGEKGLVVDWLILAIIHGEAAGLARPWPLWNATRLFLEAFQGVCRGFIPAVGRRGIDRNQLKGARSAGFIDPQPGAAAAPDWNF
jgi:hypothetical protein